MHLKSHQADTVQSSPRLGSNKVQTDYQFFVYSLRSKMNQKDVINTRNHLLLRMSNIVHLTSASATLL